MGSSWGQWSHPPGSFAGSTWGHWPNRPGFRPFPIRYPYYWRWSYPSAYWWGAWSAYYPGFWYGNAGGYADTYSYPAASYPVYPEYAAPDSNVSPDQQDEIERLKQQVSRLQDQQDQQALSTARPAPPAATTHAQTLLVFRDKHTEEVQNYAITGKTLWVFNEQRARRVPLADLDLPATTKANADRGIDFLVPQ